jgi:hypothetical protein
MIGDGHGVARFDVAALHHEHQLAVAEDRHRRGRRRIRGHVFPCAVGRFEVGAREHGANVLRLALVLEERHGDAGTRLAGGASAHGVDDDHRGAVLGHGLVHGAGGPELFHAKPGQFLAHRGHELFGIGHVRIVLVVQRSAGPCVRSHWRATR